MAPARGPSRKCKRARQSLEGRGDQLPPPRGREAARVGFLFRSRYGPRGRGPLQKSIDWKSAMIRPDGMKVVRPSLGGARATQGMAGTVCQGGG
jgi:hypothetical protein